MHVSKYFADFQKFKDRYRKLNNSLFGKIINTFDFQLLSEDNFFCNQMNSMRNKLYIIFIDKIDTKNMNDEIQDEYYIICFDVTLAIVKKSDFKIIKQYFYNNLGSIIYCLSPSIKKEIENIIRKRSEENIYDKYQEEIRNFIDYLHDECNKPPAFFKMIANCISAFMIKKSYILNLKERENNYKNYLNLQLINERVDLNDFKYVTLKNLSIINSRVDLIYSIKTEKLFILKNRLSCNEQYLTQREEENYSNINHPMFLQYYGSIQKYDQKYLLLEFIQGETLKSIERINFTYIKKMDIIFQILVSFLYLHSKNYIYRDLKPANIMIDVFGNVVIIDLDKMISCNENIAINYSHSFGKDFVAPEIINEYNETISTKADIYSIGMIIFYILSNGEKNIKEYFLVNLDQIDSISELIIDLCTQQLPYLRPILFWIVNVVYELYLKQIKSYLYDENIIKRIIVIDAEHNQFNTSYENVLEVILFNDESSFKSFYDCLDYYTESALHDDELNDTTTVIDQNSYGISFNTLKNINVMMKKYQYIIQVSTNIVRKIGDDFLLATHKIR